MPFRFGWLMVACAAFVVSACSPPASDTVAAAATTAPPAAAPTAPAAASTDGGMGGMPHGDHNPHHGGIVYMYDDMHYEVVFAPNGQHRVYFSDATREDLPASVAASVTLTVERPRAEPEALSGVIDESGESWLLTGRPVAGTDASVRVAFVVKGSQYWIDVPFIPASQ